MAISTSPAAAVMPGFAATRDTVPVTGLLSSMKSFIDSSTATTCPATTLSPSVTWMAATVPGIVVRTESPAPWPVSRAAAAATTPAEIDASLVAYRVDREPPSLVHDGPAGGVASRGGADFRFSAVVRDTEEVAEAFDLDVTRLLAGMADRQVAGRRLACGSQQPEVGQAAPWVARRRPGARQPDRCRDRLPLARVGAA